MVFRASYHDLGSMRDRGVGMASVRRPGSEAAAFSPERAQHTSGGVWRSRGRARL